MVYQKLAMKLCPKLHTTKFMWGPHDYGYLGLGSILYLNYMRYMAFLFILIGIFSIPNAYVNSRGDRWKYMESTDFAAIGSSLGNLGGSTWTPAGNNYCNNHGFVAEVCAPEGWGPANSVWNYECGFAPDSVAESWAGGPNKKCSNRAPICQCMPGFTGARCETDTRSNVAAIPGWCGPAKAWWLEPSPVRPTREDKAVRTPGVCSGRGWCEARVSETDIKKVRYTFCQCDLGFWGEDCSKSDGDRVVNGVTTYKYGDFFNFPRTKELVALCGKGVAPRIDREFIVVTFPAAQCKDHGFPMRIDTDADGKMPASNAFRPQTPGICLCEPGFNGEECLGGEPVPDMEGWFAGVCTFVLLFGTAFLYRQRKWMEQAFDDEHVTPSDFTVFVDELPSMNISEVPEVVKHFEQWGPVQSVTPATDDEVLVWNQMDKNIVLETLQMYREADHYRRAVEAWKAEGGTKPKPGPSSLPPLTNLVDADALDQPVSGLDSFLFVLCNNTGLATSLLGRAQLFRYLLWLNKQIAEEIKQPHVEEFSRAFVTFQLSDTQDNVMDSYSEEKEGVFGKQPEKDAKCLFRGAPIRVKSAPEPEEVLWASLDTGKRERFVRSFISFLIMCGVIVGMFELVRIINEDKSTGAAAIGINIALTVLNIVVATFWLYVADFEQQYSYGAKMRSVYIKTLLTQLAITVMAGTLGVYGYPLDSKNGYITDWYAEAGGFLFRQVIIEAFLPVAINYFNMPYRALSVYAHYFGTSKTLIDLYQRPSPYILAERCAALMRTVILCCIFNPGLPILNFAVAFLITFRYLNDKYCMKTLFRIQKSGPELARVLELTLMIAVVINAVMGWITLRAGWATSFISEVIFYISAIGITWAVLGYFSYRIFRGRDCWCGSGPIIPCSGWLCCFNPKIVGPFNRVHEMYMRFVFGVFFFNDFEDNLDETSGQTYEQLRTVHHLRKYPYVMFERSQLFPQYYDQTDPAEPPMTGVQYLAYLKGKRGEGAAEGEALPNVAFAVNPLVEADKVSKMKAAASQRKAAELDLLSGGTKWEGEEPAAVPPPTPKGKEAVVVKMPLLSAGAPPPPPPAPPAQAVLGRGAAAMPPPPPPPASN